MKWTAHSVLWSNRQLINRHWQKENIISFTTGFHYVFSFGTFCCGFISYNCFPVLLSCWQRRCLRCLFQNWITARSGVLCTRAKWFLLCVFISKWPGLWSGARSAQHAHVASNPNVDLCRLFFLVKKTKFFLHSVFVRKHTVCVAWLTLLQYCPLQLAGRCISWTIPLAVYLTSPSPHHLLWVCLWWWWRCDFCFGLPCGVHITRGHTSRPASHKVCRARSRCLLWFMRHVLFFCDRRCLFCFDVDWLV